MQFLVFAENIKKRLTNYFAFADKRTAEIGSQIQVSNNFRNKYSFLVGFTGHRITGENLVLKLSKSTDVYCMEMISFYDFICIIWVQIEFKRVFESHVLL